MAELSSDNDDKNVSRSGSFKLFGKSPSRNVSKKSSTNPLKRIFSKKKSEKQSSVSGDEREGSVSNEGETDIIEDDAPSVVEKIEKVVPKVIEETKVDVPKVIEDAKGVVPKAIEVATVTVPKVLEEVAKVIPKITHEAVQETKKVDPIAESKEVPNDFKTSAPATEKKPESLVNKLKENKEKIEAELHEKAKESGIEGVYKAIVAPPQTIPSTEQPLDDKQTHQRDVNIGEVKGENQENDKEDNCVVTLAQGLQHVCAQWNSKKED